MGAWGTAIFSSDLAADVRSELREQIEDGTAIDIAAAGIHVRYQGASIDPDEATAFWTALAAAQAELGLLQPDVRERAIALIDAGGDLHLFEETKHADERRRKLDELKAKLLGPQRPPVKLRRRRPIPSPVEPGDVIGLPLPDGREARLRVIALERNRYGDWPILELIDDEGQPYKDQHPLTREWAGAAQFEVSSTRRRDLPEDLRMIATQTAVQSQVHRGRSHTWWESLRKICMRLLDSPEARPNPTPASSVDSTASKGPDPD